MSKRYNSIGVWLCSLFTVAIFTRGCIKGPALERDQPTNEGERASNSSDSGLESWGTNSQEVIERLVNGYGADVVSPQITTFLDLVERMRNTIITLDDTLTRGDDHVAALSEARLAWTAATMAWQKGVFIILDRQDNFKYLYNYPYRVRCFLDRMIISEEKSEPSRSSYTALDAIEYLLYADASFGCPAVSERLEEERELWSSLSSTEILRRRITLAKFTANEIYEIAVEIQQETWTVDTPRDLEYGFTRIVKLAALLKRFVLLPKLALPLNLWPLYECEDFECLDELELRLSGLGVVAIQKNLEGIRTLFYGDRGPGIDDILIVSGAGELVERMERELTEAEAAVSDIPESIGQSVRNGDAKVDQLHKEIFDIVQLLEKEISTVLGVNLIEHSTGHMD